MPTLTQYAIGFLLVAHGWVHLVYIASSQGWFGASAGWAWNGRSWLLSGILEERRILDITGVLFGLVALGFVIGAVGYVFSYDWWMPVLIGSALLSTLLYVVMWDGQFTQLPEKGALGMLINVAVLAWVLVLN